MVGHTGLSSHTPTRSSLSVSARAGGIENRQAGASHGSGSASKSIAFSMSPAHLAKGPATAMSARLRMPGGPGMWPHSGTMPKLGLWPYTPQKAAGLRIDPAMSLPNSSDENPAATDTADPPLDPPDVFVASHGLTVVPKSSL